MENHFKKKLSDLNKTPTDIIGVSATGSSRGEGSSRGKGKPELEFKVDWLQGTFPSKYLSKAEKYVATFLGGREYKFEEREKGTRTFQRSYLHPSGALSGLGRRIPKTEGQIDEELAYMELSGEVVAKLKQRNLRRLMQALGRKCEFKATRIDLTIDDYGKSFSISQVHEAMLEHNYVGFRDTGEHKEIRHTESSDKGIKKRKGEWVSFGNRGSSGSGKRSIFYDKCAESKGKIDSHRIELSCYDEYAKQSFKQLCELPYACWGEIIGGWISGSIDFRQRKDENDKNPGRRERLAWWARIVDSLPRIKPCREYKEPSLERLMTWFKKQVSSSLAVFAHCMDADNYKEFWQFIVNCLVYGESRFNDKHRYLIEKHLMEERLMKERLMEKEKE